MPTVQAGRREEISLQQGKTLTITPAAASTGRLYRMGDAAGAPMQGSQAITGASNFGPYPGHRTYFLEVATGSISYTIGIATSSYATELGNVEGFTGARTLVADDNGKLLRCDDASPVTITVPNNLPAGFNVGIAMWGAGTVTVAAASGATKRSTTSALGTQYKLGSIIVMKNTGGSAAEFVLGGDFA